MICFFLHWEMEFAFFGIRDAVGIEFSVQGISICFFRQRESGFKQLKLGNHSRTGMIIASCL